MSGASLDPAVGLVIEARARPVGNVSVARLIPVAQRRHLGPFVFLDHLGPVSFAPGGGFDVAPHPHIGLSTVTYLFKGEALHRDSLGSVQLIRPGELNLMTAGRGVVHSERSEPAWRARGGTLHAAQLWLGLPREHEEDQPSFEHHAAEALPSVQLRGATVRVLMGQAYGERSPVRHPARPLLLELEVEAGASLALPLDRPAGQEEARGALPGEHALFIVEGAISIGAARFERNRLLVFNASVPVVVSADQHSRCLLLGGPRLDGERFIDWNFVSSSKERSARAKAEWRAQSFPRVPGDEDEFIPLP